MFHLRLRDLREDNDLTQKEVAAYLGIDQRTYSNYETEKRSMPMEQYRSLAIFYKTSVDYLVGLTDFNEPYPRTK
ncbi:MAG: helix-turn-helix domain-containing protein [Oscillibacter sp.]|nr:helix-turn-helix domain-containing protein [Oscillibacter sp.]